MGGQATSRTKEAERRHEGDQTASHNISAWHSETQTRHATQQVETQTREHNWSKNEKKGANIKTHNPAQAQSVLPAAS
jgi:hypothetical protein